MSRTDARQEKPNGRRVGWHLLSTRYLYESQWHNLRQDQVRLPNGREITFTYQEHPGFVTVVPVTPEGEIVLIRSYRYTVDAWCWEVPAGGLGNRPGQSLEDVAREELAEEAGASCQALLYLGWLYAAVGTSDAVQHIFLATGVRLDGAPHCEETEVIEVHRVPVEEALRMARSGEIKDTQSLVALLLSEPHLLAHG
ncbi:MAG: NUDIX hydrolase [Chloroflexi bacterium]|nr:NUDIX hydrolase [Chloroflexota bacterium]